MHRVEDRQESIRAKRAEYDRLQCILRKNRRIILVGSCLACLFIGFMAGFIIAYPEQQAIVVLDAQPTPEARTTSI